MTARVRIVLLVTGLLGCAVSVSQPATAQAPAPASQAFRLDPLRAPDGGVRLSWTIAPGTYLYRDRIKAKSRDGAPIAVKTEPGQVEDAPTFGRTEIYRRSARADIAAVDLPRSGDLSVTYQGCAERGICYPPITQTLDPATLVAAGLRTSVADEGRTVTEPGTWAPVPAPRR